MSDPNAPRSTVKGVYEMLWDCAYCDARELLGRTHRYCPGCGAPQDPAKRYFPPDGKETVASATWDGADRVCSRCQTATGARSRHCAHCGAPLDAAPEVARIQAPAAPQAAPAAPKRERSWFGLTVAGLLLLTCLTAGLVNHVMGDPSGGGGAVSAGTVEAKVLGHEWLREVDVEGLGDREVTVWCDALAPGANVTARTRASRGTSRVPDGERCVEKKVDRGDGTFEKREECVPKFREEPVMAEQCTTTEKAWRVVRTETGRGDLTSTPSWPGPTLKDASERGGARRESFGLVLEVPGRQLRCVMNGEARWRAVRDGEGRSVPRMGLIDGRPCPF